MKKLLTLLLAFILIFALAACGDKKDESTKEEGAKEEDKKEEVKNDENGNKEGEMNGSAELAKTLVSPAFIDPIGGWSKYDDLIVQIKAENDMAKRVKLMHEAEDILMSNYCILPLYYYNDVYLQKENIKGIYANMFQTKFFMFSELPEGTTTLRLNLSSEPAFLDPALNSSVDGACLAANSFSGLYTYNKDGKTEPACAESYTVSEDGLEYTVKLKPGLKWSDGSDLTAEDFVYSWKRAVSPKTAADYAYMYSGFDGYSGDGSTELNVKAIDPQTLYFKLSAPCAYIEDLMAFPIFYPVKQSAVEAFAEWETKPGGWCQEAGFVSNGAYVCTGWKHQESMVYEKNPYWYNADKVKTEKLEFMLSADETAVYAAYKAGNIDFADAVPTDEVASLKSNPEFHIIGTLGTYYVSFNAKSKLFDGKTPEQAACMRKAISMLIDRDYICENIAQTGQIPANSFIPIGMNDGNGGIFKTAATAEEGYFDPLAITNNFEKTLDEARELLKAAGFVFGEDGKLSAETPLLLEYLTNPTSGHIAIAEAIQQDVKELGIEMTINQQDWAVFAEERKAGNFDIARNGWIADFNDPINMLEMWTKVSGNNDVQYGRE